MTVASTRPPAETSDANLATQRTRPAQWRDLITIAALGVGFLGCGLLIGQFTAFFNVDGDIKYLAAVALTHHWLSAAIPYGFAHVDPRGHYTLPLTAWIDGHQYAGYSLPFEYLAAVSLAAFGSPGLLLPTITGTIAILLVQLRLASLLGLKGQRTLVLVATVLATPISFYALEFSEHTWGVALFLVGLALLLSSITTDRFGTWLALLAGASFALAALMRRELIIAAVLALVFVPLFWRRTNVIQTLGLAAGVCGVSLGLILVLHPEPLVLGLTHASPGRAGIVPGANSSRLRRLEWLTAGGYASFVAVVATLLVAFVRLRFPKRLPVVFSLAAAVVAITYVTYLFTGPGPGKADDNPLVFCPLVIWGLWAPLCFLPDQGRRLLLAVYAVCCVGGVATILEAYDYGGAWGARYILFVYPLLVLFAVYSRQALLSRLTGGLERRVVGFGFATLLCISILVQGIGLSALVIGKHEVARADRRIGRLAPHTIVSDDATVAALAPLYGGKRILYASDQPSLERLMALLNKRRIPSLIMTCGPRLHEQFHTRCHWDGYPGWTHGRVRHGPILGFAVYRTTR